MSDHAKYVVHVHVYYKHLWRQLAKCISNLPKNSFDLYVTSPFNETEEMVRASFPNSHFYLTENKGYDILPFLRFLQRVDLSKYEYVIKLHTKRDLWGWTNHSPMVAGLWRRYLLRFCASRRRFKKACNLLECNQDIGMVAGNYLLVQNEKQDDEQSPIRNKAKEIVGRAGLRTGDPLFVAGSMFMARSEIMSRIVDCIMEDDFAGESAKAHHSTIYHVYERVLGYVVNAAGFKIIDVDEVFSHSAFRSSVREALFSLSQSIYRATIKPLVVATGFYRKFCS